MAGTFRRVDGTREEILVLLRQRDRLGVEELAQALGLAGATVRRHLDVLQRDGLVEVTQVRGGTGRPRHIFSLTEAGAEVFPQHYVRTTQRLLSEIVALGEGETAGRSGAQIADMVFDRMTTRIVEQYGLRVTGLTPEARARAVARLVADEGIDFEVVTDEQGVRLYGRGCLCSRVASPWGEVEVPVRPCEHDRRLLQELIHAPVRILDASEVPHGFPCGYAVVA